VVLVLLWRGRREPFASLCGFRFRLRLGRLLDFFSAFVFASHVCKCATKGPLGGRQKAGYQAKGCCRSCKKRRTLPRRSGQYPLPTGHTGLLPMPACEHFVDSSARFGYSGILARCCAWGLCVFTRTRLVDALVGCFWDRLEQAFGYRIRV
jgi:hypothetical protein